MFVEVAALPLLLLGSNPLGKDEPKSQTHFINFKITPPKKHKVCAFFYLARHVVATHLEHLQVVPNLLEIFKTPSSVFVQLG